MTSPDLNESVAAFYGAYKQELYTYALSITGLPEYAEDAVQEAFRAVLNNGRLPTALRPYMFRCVRNAALDVLRHLDRDRRMTEAYSAIFVESAAPELGGAVDELLAHLSDQEREWVILKVYSGLTFREIAEVCGAKHGTVAASYWRSLRKLRAILDGSVIEENAG